MLPVRWEGKQTFWSGGILQRCSKPRVPASCADVCCFPLQLEGVKTTKLPVFELETSAFPLYSFFLVLSFQLGSTAASVSRHPSYFKHSGALRWKHVRNLDDWPSTPPPSTLSIPALCYLLRGRRGQQSPGCLDEVITAYQWHCGRRPAGLWGGASWAMSGVTLLCEMAHVKRSGRIWLAS